MLKPRQPPRFRWQEPLPLPGAQALGHLSARPLRRRPCRQTSRSLRTWWAPPAEARTRPVHVVAAGLRPPRALCSWVAHWLCRPPPVVAPHPGPSNPIQMTLLEHRQGSREWDSAQLACATARPEVACPSQPPPSLAMAPTAPGEVWAEAGLSQDPGTSPRAKLADWVPVPAAHSCTLLSGGSGRGSQCCTSVLGLLM